MADAWGGGGREDEEEEDEETAVEVASSPGGGGSPPLAIASSALAFSAGSWARFLREDEDEEAVVLVEGCLASFEPILLSVLGQSNPKWTVRAGGVSWRGVLVGRAK